MSEAQRSAGVPPAYSHSSGQDGHAPFLIYRSEDGRAQIDALVARLYDLTQAEFQHILGTFPLVDESVKTQTLNAYRELVKLGKFV